MKKTFLLAAILFLANANSGKFTIEEFTTDHSVSQKDNDVISPFTEDDFKAIQPSQAKPGAFCLRRKFGINNYGFYEGSLKKGAYEKLFSFKIEGHSFEDNVRQKFYSSKNIVFYKDLTDLYFEGNLIFIQGSSEIYYYQNDKMNKLTALPKKPARLLITSSPSGADVIINNVHKGVTPLSLGGIPKFGVLARVEKEGYYSMEDYVELNSGEEQNKYFYLNRVNQPASGTLELSALIAKDTDDPEVLTNRIARLEKELELSKTKKENFLKIFPSLTEKGEFEKLAAFEQRSKNYKKERKKALQNFESAMKVTQSNIQNAIASLKSYTREIESEIKTRKLHISSLTVKRYDSEAEYFPVTAIIKKGQFDFTFHGKLNIPISTAPDFKANKGNATLSVTYVNKLMELRENGKQVKRFVFLKDLSVHYMGERYQLKGAFKLPSYISNSLLYKKTWNKSYKMIKIPKGCYNMGSNDGDLDEKPVHKVCLDAFWIDKYEVTIGEYMACVKNGACRKPIWLMKKNKYNIHTGYKDVYKKTGMSEENRDHPVTGVNWTDAKNYCEWSGGHLPSEAEWEYAARAGSATKYFWGSSIDGKYMWYKKNSEGKVHPVGRKKPNKWGLYDMSGNVWEWSADSYGKNYYKSDSKKTSKGSDRVLRGGSWAIDGQYLRTANRSARGPKYRDRDIGFRCAQ